MRNIVSNWCQLSAEEGLFLFIFLPVFQTIHSQPFWGADVIFITCKMCIVFMNMERHIFVQIS